MSAPAGATAKGYWHGTHRSVDPGTTLARVRPHWPRLGITRLAGLTGLDRVGVPVYVACRPNARSVAVSQGKGIDVDAARASAIMEAVELWHAEQPRDDVVTAAPAELEGEGVVDVERLPRSRAGRLTRDTPIRWIRGSDLGDTTPLWVPYELVHADYTLPDPDPHHCFAANTNGLASGNRRVEAVVHGLCELIERDATTLWQLAGESVVTETGLDLTSVDDEGALAVVAALDAAAIDVAVWDATSDVGVAVFYAVVVDRDAEGGFPEFGAGCHPDRSVALLRALTEAIQARTTFISGARDDFEPAWYARAERRRRWDGCRALVEAHRPVRTYAGVPGQRYATFEADLDHLAGRLAAVGVTEIATVDLSDSELGIPVVRVVAPGLEGPYRGPESDYVPGERASQRHQAQ